MAISIYLSSKVGIVTKDSENTKHILKLINYGGLSSMVMLVYVVVLAPIAEEYIFRYLMIPINGSRISKYVSAAISALLFCFAHIGTDLTIANVINYGIISIFLTGNYLIFKDIRQNMLNHVGWNLVVMIITLI
ncbi:CPBP family intramembrane glutamic endopeptidase [Ligilactobacillus equi]|uniref:CPBP family intramembrane glutamic endopeptidase n=1 Tax=Ligilactobacillus equi TaxID=137357 RepID=UPI00138B0398|nr:CPBP family intramembrane glutamic endopeptidase [Ligilactobacillus equi]